MKHNTVAEVLQDGLAAAELDSQHQSITGCKNPETCMGRDKGTNSSPNLQETKKGAFKAPFFVFDCAYLFRERR
jgi:hypothetical protein